MRKASAAMVPLFLAIMTLFWFAYIMGGGADTLHRVNEIEDLQHLQERLLPAAMKKFIESKQAGNSNTAAAAFANNEMQIIMKKNKVDD